MVELARADPITDGIIFDLDRTLIEMNAFTDYGRALNDVRRLVGTWPDVTTPETTWDGPTRSCMAVLVALSRDPRWYQVSDTIERHELKAIAESRSMPHLSEMLAATESIPRAVVTVLSSRAAAQVLAHHGIAIDLVVPRLPDLRPKPAPDSLTVGSRLLGLEPDRVVMVGDGTWDEEAARAAGMRFIGVRNGARSVFGSGTQTVEDLGGLLDALAVAR